MLSVVSVVAADLPPLNEHLPGTTPPSVVEPIALAAVQSGQGSGGGTGFFGDSGQALGNEFSVDVALGDLDGDGDLDAFVGNSTSPGPPNKVWINDGAGNFEDSGQSLGGLSSSDVALGDLDGDGDLDAFVAATGRMKVWLNDGAGNFQDSGRWLGHATTIGVALGDLDGDGDLDAFDARYRDANKVWLNDGAGNFEDSGQSLGNEGSLRVAIGDLDGDGDLDAVVANWSSPNKVWLNDGAGNFGDSGQSLGNADSDAVALGDLDEDGDLDAFVANGGVDSPGPNKVWLNDGAGNFQDSGQSLGNAYSEAVALGDLDGDGDLDAVVANSHYRDSNKVWLNDGAGNFEDSGQSLGNASSDGVALGDLDGDGDLDAFLANRYSPDKVWLNANLAAGDANRDREFNSTDIIAVLAAGKYETGQPATWQEGDWNGDGVFNSDDIILALAAGYYEQGPYVAKSPTPSSRSSVVLASPANATAQAAIDTVFTGIGGRVSAPLGGRIMLLS